MQQEGKPRFLRHHKTQVKGVAFHPKDRFLFCSAAHDGLINLYHARREGLTSTIELPVQPGMKNINAVRFTSCGNRILAATTSRRLIVIDVNRGDQIATYDQCAYNAKDSRDRAPLAADPFNPHLAACGSTNGKGLTSIDLRMASPVDIIPDMHSSTIRDITYAPQNWPFTSQMDTSVLVSISIEGICKITRIDGRQVHSFDVGHLTNSVVTTPDDCLMSLGPEFHSSLIIGGGDCLSTYTPSGEGLGIQEELRKEKIEYPKEANNYYDYPSISKLKYTSSGSFLYAAFEGGYIRRYRRHPTHHEFLGEVYSHEDEILDMDISPYDEFLVTASRDRSVGILCLGTPTHGCTGYTAIA